MYVEKERGPNVYIHCKLELQTKHAILLSSHAPIPNCAYSLPFYVATMQ